MQGEAGQMRLRRDLSWATKVSLAQRAPHPFGYETCSSTRPLEFAKGLANDERPRSRKNLPNCAFLVFRAPCSTLNSAFRNREVTNLMCV